MSTLETLRLLTRGERPTGGLLHSCRLEAFGAEAYGEEAIVQAFRRRPAEISDAAAIIETPGHLAIIDGETALFADLHKGQVARIWRLGDGASIMGEPGISVAFEPDLAQARGDVFMTPSDHPSLAADAVSRVVRAGQEIVRRDEKDYRSRAFAIRAFGSATAGAVLFAVYRLRGDDRLTSGFAMAAAHWVDEAVRLVRDLSGERAIAQRAWTPRVGS